MTTTIVFGTSRSVETWDLLRFLDQFEIPYDFMDVEKNERALAWLQEQSGDEIVLPSLYLSSGEFVIAPSRKELAQLFGINLVTKHLKSAETKPFAAYEEDDAAV